jgi:hypothetical protein
MPTEAPEESTPLRSSSPRRLSSSLPEALLVTRDPLLAATERRLSVQITERDCRFMKRKLTGREGDEESRNSSKIPTAFSSSPLLFSMSDDDSAR